MLELFIDSQVLMIDGTFKASPPEFQQILTIMGMKNRKYFPCIHIYLKKKTTKLYKYALANLLVRYIPECINAMKIIIDFEVSLRDAIESIRKEIPGKLRDDVQIHGCLFHYAQAIYRKFRNLIREPTKEQKNLLFILLAFPYIHPTQVYEQFQKIKDLNYPKFANLIAYYQEFWIPRISEFTLHDKPFSQISTNNAIESFHRDLNRTIPGAHPNFQSSQEALFQVANRRYLEFHQTLLNIPDDDQSDSPDNRFRNTDVFFSRIDRLVARVNELKAQEGQNDNPNIQNPQEVRKKGRSKILLTKRPRGRPRKTAENDDTDIRSDFFKVISHAYDETVTNEQFMKDCDSWFTEADDGIYYASDDENIF